MISLLVCSINSTYLEKLTTSIKSTISLPYELLVLDNNVEGLSISEAYNKLAHKANYEYLVFVHEDVEFLTKDWGTSLIQILKDRKNGIIGVAGSSYLPSVPSGWYLSNEKNDQVYIHQGFKYKVAPVRFDNHGEDLTTVFLLDGVFLAMRKEVWEEFSFNEKLKGFHAYDVDLCQRVSSKYQNIFTKQIELIHHSEGKVDKNYFDSILKYKTAFLNFKYPKRDFELEFQLLEQFYNNLSCYYDFYQIKNKLLPFVKVKYLGWKGYFRFMLKLRYGK